MFEVTSVSNGNIQSNSTITAEINVFSSINADYEINKICGEVKSNKNINISATSKGICGQLSAGLSKVKVADYYIDLTIIAEGITDEGIIGIYAEVI